MLLTILIAKMPIFWGILRVYWYIGSDTSKQNTASLLRTVRDPEIEAERSYVTSVPMQMYTASYSRKSVAINQQMMTLNLAS